MVNSRAASYLSPQQHLTPCPPGFPASRSPLLLSSLPPSPLKLGLMLDCPKAPDFFSLSRSLPYLTPSCVLKTTDLLMTPKCSPLAQLQWLPDLHVTRTLKFSTWMSSGQLKRAWRHLNSFSSFLPRLALPIPLHLVKSNSIFPVAQANTLRVIFDLSLSLTSQSNPSGEHANSSLKLYPRVSAWDDKNVPEVDNGDDCMECACTLCHWTVYLQMVKMVNFMLVIVHHNLKHTHTHRI